jgi:hypothetical protein
MTNNFEIKAGIPPKSAKKPEIKVHIELLQPKKPEMKVRIRLQPPKNQNLKSPLHPILPLSTFHIINSCFLATWTFPTSLQYLRNLNISRPHDAPLFVRKLLFFKLKTFNYYQCNTRYILNIVCQD